MSFSSCISSALVKTDPSTLLRGAIGSRIVPTINVTPVASNTLLQPIAALTIPKGVWMLSGLLTVVATTGGESLAGNIGVALDAVVAVRTTIQNNVLDQVPIPLSYCFVSDGTVVLTLPTTFVTTAGTYSADTFGEQSSIVLVCIA